MSDKNATSAPQLPPVTPAELEIYTGGRIVGVAAAFLALTTLTVALRFFARRLQHGRMIWADVYMPVAWFLNVCLCASCLVCVRFGAGRVMATLPPEELVSFFKTIFYPVPTFYTIIVILPKMAVLDLYLHIFIDKYTRGVIRLLQVILVAYAVVNVPFVIAQCQPVEALWNPAAGWCSNIQQHYFWASVPNIVTDVVILILPLPTIYRLQASINAKIGILLTFLVGNVGLVTAILRFVSFNEDFFHVDQTLIATNILVWTMTEPSVYIMCACFITYRPLIHWVVQKSFLSSIFSRIASSGGSESRRPVNAQGGSDRQTDQNRKGSVGYSDKMSYSTDGKSSSGQTAPAYGSDTLVLSDMPQERGLDLEADPSGIRMTRDFEVNATSTAR